MAKVYPPQITSAVQMPQFEDALRHVAEYTTGTGLEAGFVVYTNKAGAYFWTSEVIEAGLVLGEDSEFVDTVDFKDVMLTDEGQARDDLIIMLHSHPENPHAQPPVEALANPASYLEFSERRGPFAEWHRNLLFPSGGDIALYIRVNQANPGHVGMILTSDREIVQGGMLMYRHASDSPPHIDPLNPATLEYEKDYMLKLMAAHDYRYVETEVPFEIGIASAVLRSAVPALFEDK